MIRKFIKWTTRIIVGFSALILLLLVVLSSTFDLMIHYVRYHDVIKEARDLTNETEETVYFQGDWSFDVASSGSYSNICAKRLEDGTLFVRILVNDRHHAGKNGLLYIERGGVSSSDIELAMDWHGCGEWYSNGRIWGPWWAIENNLG
tara:strand:- start:280 stop:723 length:444 start_codon:yes stop_codon:yes gene_type:complete